MAKPPVYRFPGSPTDVVVTLWRAQCNFANSKEVEQERTASDGEPAAGSRKKRRHVHANDDDRTVNQIQNRKVITEFHLWSTVLKKQSKYFEADILRWSNTTASPQSTPLRRNLTCIDDVRPAAYAQAFRAMYGAYYGESAHDVIAKAELKSLEDALDLLRVASNLGFSEGVDAAVLYIQAVPWTADEKASVAQCISLLQVQVSEDLNLRLKTAEQSVRLCRNAVRDGLVQSWKQSLLKWRNALETYSKNTVYSPGYEYELRIRSASHALSTTMIDICNSMFGLLAHAASLGVGQTLVYFLVEDGTFQELLTESRYDDTIVSYEVVLLLLLRIMRALSQGEVLCQEELREKMVCKCVTAFTGSSSPVQQHTYQSLRANTRSMWCI